MQLLTQPERIESIVVVAPLTPVTLSSLTNEDTISYNNNKAWRTIWEEDEIYQEAVQYLQ